MNEHDALSHEQAIELLPWLVNDSLAATEKAAVVAHARSCVVCRRELAELEALRDEIGAAGTQADSPPVDMRRINRRIDEYIARRRRLPVLVDAIGGWFSSPLKVAVVVQSIVIAGLLLALVLPRGTTPAYTTLTTEAALPPGDYLRVVVSTQMTGERLAGLLERHGLTLVDGPSARGVATLTFAAAVDADGRRQIVDALAEEEDLRFVQPLTVAVQP